jgi:hypothetical protein
MISLSLPRLALFSGRNRNLIHKYFSPREWKMEGENRKNSKEEEKGKQVNNSIRRGGFTLSWL